MIEILRQNNHGAWESVEEIHTDVHAYTLDSSYRCFHICLPKGLSTNKLPLKARINASTGTELMTYQGYNSADGGQHDLKAEAKPIEIDIGNLGEGNGSLFYPFTTTLIKIILNRESLPLDGISKMLKFLEDQQ
ncbi:MAG: hypothetical protein PHY16_14745 [Methylobacter sp.]|nr:hypothetical protein [Methylobacter sp.]